MKLSTLIESCKTFPSRKRSGRDHYCHFRPRQWCREHSSLRLRESVPTVIPTLARLLNREPGGCIRQTDDRGVFSRVTYVQVENSAVALATLPLPGMVTLTALKLVGVTGTNGKTTIATLPWQLFRNRGYAAGLISTVANYVDGESIPPPHPDPLTLNAFCDAWWMLVVSMPSWR